MLAGRGSRGTRGNQSTKRLRGSPCNRTESDGVLGASAASMMERRPDGLVNTVAGSGQVDPMVRRSNIQNILR